ncbi:MAG: hypothetical protein HQ567_12060 [Candidatus Nealsonbacteria bacterium]|nr:hypothetical protein [Candidatus Nealsonbacteria bacterium]
MPDCQPESVPRKCWWRYVVRALVGVALVGVAVVCWMVYTGISVSLDAENNLHATTYTIRLVEQYVSQHGRWPESWEELDDFAFSEDGLSVPAEVRERITIDFDVDPAVIIDRDPEEFVAIRPIGPCYTYHHYNCIPALQKALRSAIEGGGPSRNNNDTR